MGSRILFLYIIPLNIFGAIEKNRNNYKTEGQRSMKHIFWGMRSIIYLYAEENTQPPFWHASICPS
jgi:hypothetical protein